MWFVDVRGPGRVLTRDTGPTRKTDLTREDPTRETGPIREV